MRKTRVLILGGGFGGLYAALEFEKRRDPDCWPKILPRTSRVASVRRWLVMSGEEVAKQRPRVEIIKWNNKWRYKRLSEMPDPIQEFMEEYAPEFVPPEL